VALKLFKIRHAGELKRCLSPFLVTAYGKMGDPPGKSMALGLSIKTKLTIGFAFILFLIALLLTITYQSFDKVSRASGAEAHAMSVMQGLQQLEVTLLRIEAGARADDLSESAERSGTARTAELSLPSVLSELERLVQSDADQLARVRSIRRDITQWQAEALSPRGGSERREGTADAVVRKVVKSETPLGLDAVYGMIGAARAIEAATIDKQAQLVDEIRARMLRAVLIGGTATLLLTSGAALWLRRTITRPLHNLAEAISLLGAGTITVRAHVTSKDEFGQIALQFNRMAQSIQDSLARETASHERLRSGVGLLQAHVARAATGDLDARVEVAGPDMIGQLGEALEAMFGKLRGLLSEVHSAESVVNASALEIAASAREGENLGIEQAQVSVQVLAAAERISDNTAELLRTMQGATAVADRTSKMGVQARERLADMDSAMEEMLGATTLISAKLADLAEKAKRINSILATITKIADQTNLLSLNAAIEAEYAGDNGRGFGVVAIEIRRLSDQIANSAADIEKMLKEMDDSMAVSMHGMETFSRSIGSGARSVEAVSEQLSGVIGQVQTLAPQFDAVLEGMKLQSAGADQISHTISRLSEASQNSSESQQAASRAAEQLNHAAAILRSSINPFVTTRIG